MKPVISTNFVKALCKHLGISQSNVYKDFSIDSEADDFLFVNLKIMLSAEDLEATAKIMKKKEDKTSGDSAEECYQRTIPSYEQFLKMARINYPGGGGGGCGHTAGAGGGYTSPNMYISYEDTRRLYYNYVDEIQVCNTLSRILHEKDQKKG